MLTTNNFYGEKAGCDNKIHKKSGIFTNMVLKAMALQNRPVSIEELITITRSETRKKRIWNALATLAHYDIVDRVQSDGCNKWFVKNESTRLQFLSNGKTF
jgi:Fe2+ or Zn2+ uptake regulation protein